MFAINTHVFYPSIPSSIRFSSLSEVFKVNVTTKDQVNIWQSECCPAQITQVVAKSSTDTYSMFPFFLSELIMHVNSEHGKSRYSS